VYTHLILQC